MVNGVKSLSKVNAVQDGLKGFFSLSLSVDEILKHKLTLTSSTKFCTFF